MSAKSDVVVKLALVFFISLLSFSIGTFVGKKYSDNQHKLATLEPGENAHTNRDVASIVDENGKPEAGAMKDDDIAKIASEFADDENQKTEPETAANKEEKLASPEKVAAGEKTEKTETGEKVEKAEKTAPEHVAEKAAAVPAKKAVATEEPSGPAKSIVAHKPPTEEKAVVAAKENKEDRTPSSLPKDVANYAVGKFTVQIASYLTETEAHDRAEGLKKQGYSAFYVPASVKGTIRYRVNVGLFASESEAKTYRTEFMTKAKVDSALVQKVTN